MLATQPSSVCAASAILEGVPIISFAVDRWTDVPRCRHHVMSRLAERNPVIFAGLPWYIRDAFRRDATERERGLTRITSNLYTYRPPRWLPYSYRFRLLDRCALQLRCNLLARSARTLGMARPILYIWHPMFADVIGQFDERLVVYHCYDEYAAFGGADRAAIDQAEARILRAADLVLTVSEGLQARKRVHNENTYLVRNGVDFPLFASARQPETAVAPELRSIRRPIIGCVTRIVPEYFDAAMLRQIFAARSDWSFVVVGPQCAESPELSALAALPNVHMIGRRALTELPSYIAAFDVCLIPYVLTENKRLADPLKLYEYLAAGKPVVSKPIAGVTSFGGDVVTVASTAAEWIDAIDEAIRTDCGERIARRQAVARQNTWDDRVELISGLIARALAQNGEGAAMRTPRRGMA